MNPYVPQYTRCAQSIITHKMKGTLRGFIAQRRRKGYLKRFGAAFRFFAKRTPELRKKSSRLQLP